jgi:DNA primase
MPEISQEKITELEEKTDIVSLVSEFIPLTKAGADYKGICPFHNENTPSFMISPSKKIAKCMGCGEGGRPIKFLMKIKNISFLDACLELSKRNGVALDIKDNRPHTDNSKYYKMMKIASEFYIHYLRKSKSGLEALDYLKKRGLNDSFIDKFEIGLAPKESDSLYQVLKKEGFNEIDMLDVGLIKENDGRFYDLFIKRIMFPIKDEQGNIVAFSGRIYNSTDPNQAKYMNSPENKIFKKNSVLFNLYNALESIRKNKRIVLHEGQMDVISAYRAGVGEALCSLGTALTMNQAKIIKKYSDNVVISYDSDNAGLKAMVKAIKIFKSIHIDPKICMMPQGLDPDEYVMKYGEEKYLDYFNNHIISSNDYLYKYSINNLDLKDLLQIEQAKNNIFSYLRDEKSNVVIEATLKRFSIDSNISLSSLMSDFKGNMNNFDIPKNRDLPEIKSGAKERKFLGKPKAFGRLFQYAIRSKDKANIIDITKIDNIKFPDAIQDERFGALWMKLIDEYYQRYNEFNEYRFLELLTDSEHDTYLSIKKNQANDLSPYTDKDMQECIKGIYRFYSESKAEQIKKGEVDLQGLNSLFELRKKANKKYQKKDGK